MPASGSRSTGPRGQKDQEEGPGISWGGNNVVKNMQEEKEEDRHEEERGLEQCMPGILRGAGQKRREKQLPNDSRAGQGPQEF